MPHLRRSTWGSFLDLRTVPLLPQNYSSEEKRSIDLWKSGERILASLSVEVIKNAKSRTTFRESKGMPTLKTSDFKTKFR